MLAYPRLSSKQGWTLLAVGADFFFLCTAVA